MLCRFYTKKTTYCGNVIYTLVLCNSLKTVTCIIAEFNGLNKIYVTNLFKT